jgi:ADP-ribosylglycohydrolase
VKNPDLWSGFLLSSPAESPFLLESRSKRNEMSNKGKSMVMASFVADSLALGAHWIYDTEEISSKFGKVDTLLKPVPDSYHSTKEKGEFTHYGDQSLVLLESIAAKRGFDLTDFSDRWRALFEDYKGYIDQATKITLSNYAAGKTAENAGSPSDELAGASRMAPLVFCNSKDPVKLAEDVRAQTSMTHQDPLTLDSAEFFALITRRVLMGSTPVEAIKQVSDERFAQSPLSQWAAEGLESRDKESVPVISNFGQT